MQNFGQSRLNLLPRIVEALVQAIVNPFQSRPIELQALKGLLTLMTKHSKTILADTELMRIWAKPISSRLASSDRSTREQARLILQEAGKHMQEWDAEAAQLVQDCMEQYALPSMKAQMDQERNKEALALWTLLLLLLRPRLASNLKLLNEILYIPEVSMRHTDGAVRLLSMEAWRHLVEVFRQNPEWIFKKPILQLLLRPVRACLEEETLRNVVHASFVTWKTTLAAIVLDFNAFCKSQDNSPEQIQTNSKRWKRWFDEAVAKVIDVYVKARLKSRAENDSLVLQSCELMWRLDDAKESFTELDRKANISADTDSTTSDLLIAIGSELIGVAFLLPDALATIKKLIGFAQGDLAADARNQLHSLILAMWNGICGRCLALASENEDKTTSKLRLRLARLCLDFAFEVSASTANTSQATENEDPAPANPTTSLNAGGAAPTCDFLWQIHLIAPVVRRVSSGKTLLDLFLHTKSRLPYIVVDRVRSLQSKYESCAKLLSRWGPEAPENSRVDIFAKSNVVICAMLYLVMEYAVMVDDGRVDDATRTDVVESVAVAVERLAKCVLENDPLTAAMRQFVGVIQSAVQAFGTSQKSDLTFLMDRLQELAQRSDPVVKASGNATAPSLEQPLRAQTLGAPSEPVGTEKEGRPIQAEGTQTGGSHHNISMSSDASASSPCLLVSSNVYTASANSPQKAPEPASARQESNETPSFSGTGPFMATPQKKRLLTAERTAPGTPSRPPTTPSRAPQTPRVPLTPSRAAPITPSRVPLTPSRSVATPSRASATTPSGKAGSTIIYPELAQCTEGIATLYRHFPLAFRPFFSFYKIRTIGDLSSMTLDQVKSFGIKDPVATVTKALDEYNGRKQRLKDISSSPFRQRALPSPMSSPQPKASTLASPSPRRILKRPLPPKSPLTPLPLEGSPQRKRARRSIRELSSELDAADELAESLVQRSGPKIAERVTFCLPTGEGGSSTRITRPGEDSQEQLAPSARESAEEKMQNYTTKLLQHLQRSAYYMDKLVVKEESMHSDASLQTNALKMSHVLADFQQAHELITRMSLQLQNASESSAKRCQQMLEQNPTDKS